MDLGEVQALLIDDTRSVMSSLVALTPIATKAQALRDLCRLFQGVGICRLLVDADLPKFRENLVRSAQTRRYHLRHAHAEAALDDRFLGLSRVDAIFDGIVAGADDLVREIVALSVEQWHEGWEYEDDHCYYLFFHRLATQSGFAVSAEAPALLKRFEQVLDGQVSPRRDLCQAIVDQHPEHFHDALEAFLAQRKAMLDEQRICITEYTAQALFWPQSFVSIEALAWLRLTESLGFPMLDEFMFCPREARARGTPPEGIEDLLDSLDTALATPEV